MSLQLLFDFFTQIQVYTGLSAPSLILVIIAMYRSFMAGLQRGDGIVAVLAQTAFFGLVFILFGYFVVNHIWNLFLAWIR
ncbi:hypothetical protein DRO97_01965 [Archaeoglobales archaeon]|nr:MAG: hypothetical protein DRO97_01965 [Archaeoglobales archaeon]